MANELSARIFDLRLVCVSPYWPAASLRPHFEAEYMTAPDYRLPAPFKRPLASTGASIHGHSATSTLHVDYAGSRLFAIFVWQCGNVLLDGDLMHLNIIDDVANLVFVGAYWVKDILWLRLLSILGSLVVIPYYLLQSEPLWTPMIWSFVFISINAVRAWSVVKERRPVALTTDEQLLYDKTFHVLSRQQFKRLLAIGEWQDLGRGHVLYLTGDPPDSLLVVVRGELEARRHGRVLGVARSGDLAGLASVLGHSPELYDAKVTQPARVIRWQLADLQQLARSDEKLASVLRMIAGAALAEKLVRFVQTEL